MRVPIQIRIEVEASHANFLGEAVVVSADRTAMPNYPDEALKKTIGGQVILAVQYSTEGNVEAVERIEGNPLLLPSAIQAATLWSLECNAVNRRQRIEGGPETCSC